MWLGMIINMMTEKEFWDKFNKKHNPTYYYGKEKKKTKDKKKTSRPKSIERNPVFKVQD